MRKTLDAESEITGLIRQRGPQTGLDIKKAIDGDSLVIWKTCKSSPGLIVRKLGKRYMRLDRHVDGLARLSPSILREFFTYSVVGCADDQESLERRCIELIGRIREISRFKFDLARQMISDIMEEFNTGVSREHRICFIIAGDIVYEMAHDVPRPERSTGRLVRGSDIDLVAVIEDDLPDALVNKLDQIIYNKKYRMLIDPSVNEEVDYKIKRLALIKEQIRFDNFKYMVACKILDEGELLYGDRTLYREVKAILREEGIPEKLEELRRTAEIFRKKAEDSILFGGLDKAEVEKMHLFYSAEEFEEFE